MTAHNEPGGGPADERLSAEKVRPGKVVAVSYFQPQCDRCGYRGSLYVKPADAELVVKDHNHRRHSDGPVCDP